ncbi:hypothetical protein CXP40_16350 [Pseudomonas sp. YY-1]|uniref:hypothetical protein n=1 Tax=Pseudomonas sp. YY-1 TaxID=2058659 RepID=UPI000CAEE54F|nr:hypothetical protein [Pseudomonas sp. YY-1]PKQ40345.1 hypothetical protein CXP40_16350 [Pseudomonas sp. YY-1]
MASLYTPYTLTLSPPPAPPHIQLQFRFLRDGEVTSAPKILRLFRGYSDIADVQLVFFAEGGEYSNTCSVSLAVFLAQGEWLAIGLDDALPRRIRATYLAFAESGTYTFNITSGEGGGQQGDPARVAARVRVERLPVNREVVLLERPIDGEWRLAGYGPTPGGSVEIDLRVVGGDVYALAVDDYGVRFVADLAVQVGQRIRPTQYTGWVYEITQAGQLPSVEPAWWAAVGENPSQPLGTARAVARRYFQPIALGPGPVEVV